MDLPPNQLQNINIPLIQKIIKQHLNLPQNSKDLKLAFKNLGGLSNFIYKVQLKDESSIEYPEAPIFVYKKYSQFFQCLIDREREQYICEQFSSLKIGPQVIYVDQIQRIEIFLDLQNLPVQKMSTNINYITKIAEILGKFHKQFNSKTMFQNTDNSPDLNNILMDKIFQQEVQDSVCENIKNTILLNPEQKQEATQIFDNLFSENFKNILQKDIIPRTTEKLVFAHNDLNSTNFLYNTKILENSIYLIDFEYSGFNYRAHEFGNFFNELTYDYEIDQPPYFQINLAQYPSIDKQQLFFAFYLMTYNPEKYGYSSNQKIRQILSDKIQINNDYNQIIQQSYDEIIQQVPEEFQNVFINDVELLIQETNIGRIFSHIFWLIIGALSLSYTDLQFDLYLYIKIRNEKINSILKELQISQNNSSNQNIYNSDIDAIKSNNTTQKLQQNQQLQQQ